MHTATCEPRCNIAHERIATEDRLIRRFIRQAKNDGWRPFAVSHEETVLTTTESAVIEETKACDESNIRFRHTSRNLRSFVSVVRGNGEDCLIDCGSQMESTYNTVHDLMP